MPTLGPRLVIAGTHSGVGKTTVATGLMAAFSSQGRTVQSAKVGPDYIDPGYHALATGRVGCSLDAWLSGEELLPALAADASKDADLTIVEGVMGLFDGSAQPGCDGSTAGVAHVLRAPVVLVIDASAMSGSVAAVVHGFHTLDTRVQLAGVIFNRVGSEGHGVLLREALEPLRVPVLGVIYHDGGLTWRERHLGLVPVAEHPDALKASIQRVGHIIAANCDLAAIDAIARSAPTMIVGESPCARKVSDVLIALAAGPAFSFNYPENLKLLKQAGASLIPFDPRSDTQLPTGCRGLFAGGGFPEVFAAELSANTLLLQHVRERVLSGLVTWAECGGLLWLSRSLDGAPMAGVLETDGSMTERLTIGYRSATTLVPSPLGPTGTLLKGHEFHRSALEPSGDALELSSRFGTGRSGYATPTLFASYLHQHLAAVPAVIERFVGRASAA